MRRAEEEERIGKNSAQVVWWQCDLILMQMTLDTKDRKRPYEIVTISSHDAALRELNSISLFFSHPTVLFNALTAASF